jgi:hypothetical protein
MNDAEIIAAATLFTNLVVLLITTIINGKIERMRSLMYETFVTKTDFINFLNNRGSQK